MIKIDGTKISRRKLFRNTAVGVLVGVAGKLSEEPAAAQAAGGVNKNSAPSDLKITDVRAATTTGAESFRYPVIRIDTNQGVSGLGEVFVTGSAEQALLLKPYLVGKNPLVMEPILQQLRRFTTQANGNSGAYSAVDVALHDIAGKVYGVPVWRLLGSKLQDRVRLYCDTDSVSDPKVYAARMLERKKMGFTVFKMDLQTTVVKDKPGALDGNGVATEKGLGYMGEFFQGVRDAIGWDQSLGADHMDRGPLRRPGAEGNLSVKDAIRYARSFEKYQLAFAEDLLPYTDYMGFKAVKEATTTPLLTGEFGFGLPEAFKPLVDNRSVDYLHLDVTTCGGLLEMRKTAEYAALNGIQIFLHQANGPVAQVASIHAAAAMMNFVALEFHGIECPFYQDLVKGPAKPLITKGYHAVPDAPGLGIEMNEEAVRQHLTTTTMRGVPTKGGYFEPSPEFDQPLLSPNLSR